MTFISNEGHGGERKLLFAVAMIHFAVLPTAGQAARPMITDDARLVDAKACQVESWARHNVDSTEFWALPACNPTGNLEISFGGSGTRAEGVTETSNLVLQGKTLFRTLETDSWSYGLAFGVGRHPNLDSGRGIDEAYAYVPITFSLKHDQVFVHWNLGLHRDRKRSETRMTWGLATEVAATTRGFVVAEVFGRDRGKPLLQLGYRHWLVPNHVQVDVTYGNQFGLPSQERWFTLGLRFLTSPFLP